MGLTINDTAMTSDHTGHTARQAPGRPHGWEVSWLPGQILDRDSAITAMVLAHTAAQSDVHEGHRLWPHIQSWAEELGLTGTDAIAQISQPPPDHTPQEERDGGQLTPGNETADSQTWRQPTEQPQTRSRSAHRTAELPASSGHAVGNHAQDR